MEERPSIQRHYLELTVHEISVISLDEEWYECLNSSRMEKEVNNLHRSCVPVGSDRGKNTEQIERRSEALEITSLEVSITVKRSTR